jgi:hypothetical protein
MTTALPLLEPLDEQPAASPAASSTVAAADSGLLMGILCTRSHLLGRDFHSVKQPVGRGPA